MTTTTLPRALLEQALGERDRFQAELAARRAALAQQDEPVQESSAYSKDWCLRMAQIEMDAGAEFEIGPDLAQQAEPVAAERERCAEYLMQQAAECRENSPTRVTLESCAAVLRLGLHAQAEPVEPVAWMYTGIKQDGTEHGPHLVWKPEYMDAMSASKGAKAMPLYTAPPQRKPLTEEEIERIWRDGGWAGRPSIGLIRAVERAHGITDPQVEDRLARHGIPMPGDPK